MVWYLISSQLFPMNLDPVEFCFELFNNLNHLITNSGIWAPVYSYSRWCLLFINICYDIMFLLMFQIKHSPNVMFSEASLPCKHNVLLFSVSFYLQYDVLAHTWCFIRFNAHQKVEHYAANISNIFSVHVYDKLQQWDADRCINIVLSANCKGFKYD